ncbi:MAG: helix-turn-helix domain-containing protein [Clostridium sp.]|nr:helix-turn-helix domain-containing protein [Clostridium sp.]
MNATKLFICILTLIFAPPMFAQSKTLVFTDIPSSGALRTSTVHTFHKDSNQMLWIGTDKEIIAFDGNNSMHTSILDANGLPSTAYAFVETANSDIVAATGNGVYLIDFTSADSQYSRVLEKEIGSATCLAVTSSDSILIGTNSGFYVASPDLSHCYGPLLRTFKIKSIIPDGQRAFIATDQGVYSIDLQTKKPTLLYGPINATDLLRDGDRLYASSSTGVIAVIDINKGSSHAINCGEGIIITEIDNDSRGNIFISTDGDGVFRLDKATETVTPFNITRLKSNDDHNRQVYAIMIDRFDRMHLGYYMMGAEHSLLKNDIFSIFDIPAAGDDLSVRAVYTDGDELMVGTRNGAFFLNKATGKTCHISKEQLGTGLVLTIEKYKGKYAIGTYGGGLAIFDPATGEIKRHHDKAVHGSVFSLSVDKSGNLWMGTSSGVIKTNGSDMLTRIEVAEEKDSLANIYSVFFDSHGRGWAASAMGTYSIDTDKSTLSLSDKITEKDVRQIYETRNHSLWVVTNSGQISVYDSDLKRSEINRLVSSISEARGVVEDDYGHIWITTANGLYRCSPFDDSLSLYGFADGIPTPMFNSGAPKISADGILYLCHTAGLLHSNLKSATDGILSRRKAHPSFIAEADGKRMLKYPKSNDAYIVELSSPQKNVKLSLTDAAFSGNEMPRYEYSTDKGGSWTHVGSDMNIPLHTAGETSVSLLVRQIGNPLTETNIAVHNPKGYANIFWFGLAISIIVIVSAGWAYTLYIYKKRHRRPDSGQSAMDNGESPSHTSQASPQPADEAQTQEAEGKKYATNYLSEKECAKIAKQVRTLLLDTKIYTDPDLKIATIADKVGVSSHKLSYVFSQHLHTSYYDYIYEFRVEEFKRLAQADKKQAFTLVALSEKAGFNSRATFFRAFKKLEGITPGDYLRQLREK